MSGPLVEVDGVGLRFPTGVEALRDTSMRLAGGEFVAIIGPSGCGKSTLLRLIAGLLPPSSGRIALGGVPPIVGRAGDHPVAMVFQQPTLLPWRTVRDNVTLPLELGARRGASGRSDPARQMLTRVGLANFADAYPIELSGGMQMRVAVARALVTRPAVLLMDEPFAAADEITRQRLGEELLALHAAERFVALFVTHSVFEAVFLADRILVMGPRPGTIVGEIAVTLPRPRSAELRGDPAFARLVGEAGRALAGAHP
jgi:NitT/TauT family transport system ATP-binding protein